GKVSQLSRFSSPLPPLRWPSRMRAAATVVRLMPSPRNRITFFARPRMAPRAAACAAPSRNHQAGVSSPGWRMAGTSIAAMAGGGRGGGVRGGGGAGGGAGAARRGAGAGGGRARGARGGGAGGGWGGGGGGGGAGGWGGGGGAGGGVWVGPVAAAGWVGGGCD